MAFKWVTDTEPEEPIANLLGKIPGVGGFLKSAQQQTSPKGFYGPGVVSQLLSKIPKNPLGSTPDQVYANTLPGTELAAGMAAGGALPTATFLQRFAGNTLTPMIESLISGDRSIEGALLKGGIGGVVGTAVEGILRGVKQHGAQKLLSRAETAWKGREVARTEGDRLAQEAWEQMEREISQKNAAKSYATKKATESWNRTQQQMYAQAVRAQAALHQQALRSHGDVAARSIMDDAKSVIPAWAELTSDVPGLMTAVTGKGKRLLQQGFDKAMKEAVERARGVPVPLDVLDAGRLYLAPRKSFKNLAGGPDLPGVILGDDGITPTHILVDAGELIEKMGKMPVKGRDWALYDRLQGVLADADVGISQEARDAYRTGIGVMKHVDETGAIRDRVFDTEKIVGAMYSVKQIDTIRNRSLGDLDEGMFQVARGAPPTPEPIPKPDTYRYIEPPAEVVPPKPKPTPPELDPVESGEFSGVKLPGGRMGRATALGAAGGAAGYLVGGWPARTVGAGLGGLLGAATPDFYVTRAPGLNPLEQLLGRLAQPYTTATREGLTQALPALLEPSAITEADRQEIEAVKAARARRLANDADDEGLSLDIQATADE